MYFYPFVGYRAFFVPVRCSFVSVDLSCAWPSCLLIMHVFDLRMRCSYFCVFHACLLILRVPSSCECFVLVRVAV